MCTFIYYNVFIFISVKGFISDLIITMTVFRWIVASFKHTFCLDSCRLVVVKWRLKSHTNRIMAVILVLGGGCLFVCFHTCLFSVFQSLRKNLNSRNYPLRYRSFQQLKCCALKKGFFGFKALLEGERNWFCICLLLCSVFFSCKTRNNRRKCVWGILIPKKP